MSLYRVELPLPPSVNRMYRGGGYKAKGRRFKAQNYKDWEIKAEKIIKDVASPNFTQGVWYHYNFIAKNKTFGDCENYTKALTDFLVKHKVMVDDKHTILENMVITFGGYDKSNPRVEVTVGTKKDLRVYFLKMLN